MLAEMFFIFYDMVSTVSYVFMLYQLPFFPPFNFPIAGPIFINMHHYHPEA